MCNTIEACPLCTNTTSEPYYKIKDFSVTKKFFSLVKCSNCSFIYTNPRPSEQDIGRYYESNNYISHAQKGQNIIDRIYYLVRYFMLRKKLNWLNEILGGQGRLLDYGCGTGSFVSLALKNYWDVWGIEPNDQARTIANKNGAYRVLDNLEALSENQFEAITLWHVLEHIPDLEQTINALLSRLAKSGYLVIAIPNCASYDAQYYKEYWAGFDVPRHLSHFTPESMKFLIKKHRLHLVKLIPLKLDAFYICMLSEKYRDGSIFKAILLAVKSNFRAKRDHLNYSSLVYVLRK